jgi:iron complex transport system permease protein
MSPEARRTRTIAVFVVLGLLVAAAAAAFMTLGAQGRWDFVLPFRGKKLLALILVAYAIAVSTVLFQTVVNNRILTPSIMGFDALYVLIQTVLMFSLGATRVVGLDPRLMFLVEVAALVLFAGILFRWLFSGATRSIHLLMLVGIVFGVFFRSLSGFLQRVIDPNDFVVLQDRLFASFNTVDASLLGLAAVLIALASLVSLRMLAVYDVLALGRETAINLGVEHKRAVTITLGVVTTLVAVSTALVGPVTFFGLLVANLAYLLLPTARHALVLPAAILVAILALVGGQVILERVLAFDTALSIIIEFVGGLFFIFLVVRGTAR